MRESIPPFEQQALTALYDSTSGESWQQNDGWLSDAPPGAWHGVTVRNGHVVGLDLANNNLSGPLPTELGRLTLLRTLDLSRNALRGTIPEKLGHLKDLRKLNLAHNQLRGPIPGRLRLLLHLTRLDLHDNQLSGEIPSGLGDLARLTHLNLAENRLQGPVPATLGQLSQLLALSLEKNQLEGRLPEALLRLATLETFTFQETKLIEPGEEDFQAWLRNLLHVESTGVVDIPATSAAPTGAVGAWLPVLIKVGLVGLVGGIILVVTLPLLGPLPGVILALAGAAGAGYATTKLPSLPGERAPAPQALTTRADAASSVSAQRLEKDLRYLVNLSREELPDDATEKVIQIASTIIAILPRFPNLASGEHKVYTVRQTVLDYLPEAINNYRALPREYAETEPLEEGKTAHQLLVEQLTVLAKQIHAIAAEFPQSDAQRLMIHGRFLEDKFAEEDESSWI